MHFLCSIRRADLDDFLLMTAKLEWLLRFEMTHVLTLTSRLKSMLRLTFRSRGSIPTDRMLG